MRAIESEVSRALQKSAGRFVDERIIRIPDKMSAEVSGAVPINPETWITPRFEISQVTQADKGEPRE